MKKLYTIFAILMMAFTVTAFTSCDDDENIAYNLAGVWQGNMYMQSEYNGRVYKASYSVLAFDKDPYRYAKGNGYWIDYYSNAPYDYYSSRIDWRVYNGEIQIYSRKEGVTYYISQYNMDDYYFTGYIDDGRNRQYFRLTKTSSPDWGDYNWNGYDWDDDYYYAPAKPKTKGSDQTQEPVRSVSPKE